MTRCTLAALATAAALMAAAPAFSAQKYGAKATIDKKVDFASFHTYAWTPTRPSADPDIHQQIIAAVERELASLGMTKAGSDAADVLVTYSSVARTDVETGGKGGNGTRPEQTVGTLVVALLDKTTRDPLLRLRIDKPMAFARDTREASINGAVAELFTKYPTRAKK